MYQVPGDPLTEGSEYPASQERVKNLFYRVYGWMALALLLTGFTALTIASKPQWMHALVTRPYLGLSLLMLQLVVVFVFAGMLARLSLFNRTRPFPGIRFFERGDSLYYFSCLCPFINYSSSHDNGWNVWHVFTVWFCDTS